MRNSAKKLALITAGFFFLAIICWYPLFLGGLIPADGNMLTFYYPHWKLAKDAAENLTLPLWNYYSNMGEPFLADPQNFFTYPLFQLFRFGDFRTFMKLWVFFHSALAFWSFRALFRKLYAGAEIEAFAAAAIFAFGGFFLAKATQPTYLASAAWLPLSVLLLLERKTIPCAITLAMQWLAGFPPYFMISIILMSATALAKGRRYILCLLWAVVISLALAAFQILPFIQMLSESMRGLLLAKTAAFEYSVPPFQLLKQIFIPFWPRFAPDISGDPAVMYFYPFFIAVPLAIYAAIKGGKKERWLAAGIVVSLLLCLGKFNPAYRFIPGITVFRFPAHWLFPASVFSALLGGAGLTMLKCGKARLIIFVLLTAEMALHGTLNRIAWAYPSFYEETPRIVAAFSGKGPGQRIFHSDKLTAALESKMLTDKSDYGTIKEILMPSYGTAFGLPEVKSYQPLRLAAAAAYQERIRASSEPARERLLDIAACSHEIELYSPAQAVKIKFRPSGKQWLFCENKKCEIADLSMPAPGILSAKAVLKEKTKLIWSEVYSKGWNLEVDGKKAGIALFENTFISTDLLPGAHTIKFSYKPAVFKLGSLISILTLMAVIIRLFYGKNFCCKNS